MTHTSTEQPEALRLADKYEIEGFLQDHRFAKDHWCRQAAAELRHQHARIEELGEQLAAIGAGGVALRKARVTSSETKISALMSKISTLVDKRLSCEPCAEAEEDLLQFLRTRYAAPAHPAEGVPAQAGPVGYVTLAALTSRTHADDYAKCFATEAALLENYPAAKAIAVFDHAATNPTKQGLDAAEWEEIHTLPTCDDLIWLYCQDTNTVDGPLRQNRALSNTGGRTGHTQTLQAQPGLMQPKPSRGSGHDTPHRRPIPNGRGTELPAHYHPRKHHVALFPKAERGAQRAGTVATPAGGGRRCGQGP